MPKSTRLLHVTSSSLLAFLVILVLSVHDSHQNLEASVPDFMRREHSLIKPYGGGGGIPSWDFIGSTIVTNKFVRLTSDSQSLQGALWNTLPVDMTDWEVQFQFSVHGKGKDLFGDGFVFWYVRDRNQFGPVFGSKDYFHGLAIILDTYSNHNGPHNHPHPYISAMVNNGSLHYDHDKDGTHTELAGCEAPFRNRDYDTFVAVRYQNYKLTVSMDIDNKNEWKECFSVDHVRLPTRYHFGFSAATGDLSDNHDIISVKTYGLDSDRKFEKINPALIEPVAETFAAPREHAEDDEQPSQAWRVFKIIFIIILVISLLMVIAYVSYVIYDKQKRTKKRFY